MPDETKAPEPETRAEGETAPEAAAQGPGKADADAGDKTAGSSPEADPDGLELRISKLEMERDSIEDQLMRALADMDNLRKRADRERADTAKFAIARFAQDIVGVGDSFQHAIAAVPPGAAEKDPALKSFLEGVTLAERAFLAALERHGVTMINPLGETFSPHRHHAASEEQNPDVAPGTITKVYQVGYLIEDRVLRPAMVVVARGGKKPATPEEPSAPANENAAPEAGETGETPAPEPSRAAPSAGGDKVW